MIYLTIPCICNPSSHTHCILPVVHCLICIASLYIPLQCIWSLRDRETVFFGSHSWSTEILNCRILISKNYYYDLKFVLWIKYKSHKMILTTAIILIQSIGTVHSSITNFFFFNTYMKIRSIPRFAIELLIVAWFVWVLNRKIRPIAIRS